MILSYTLRLICLAVVVTGLLQALIEVCLWLGAPLVLRLLAAFPIRQRERLLYCVQIAPLLLSLLFVGGLCVPQYLRSETNLAAEKIGWLCLLLLSAVLLWYGQAVFRGVRIALRTFRFIAVCKRVGRNIESPRRAARIVAFPEPAHRMALVGLVRPFILISGSLMEGGILSRTALDIALDHECSHAAQRDNWKLLSLWFLPRLPLRLPSGGTWMQLWQRMAEWAADDDAVRGDSARALLLAETLIAVARPAARKLPSLFCTALICRDADLAARVERLIHAPLNYSVPVNRRIAFVLAASLAALAAGAVSLAPWLHSLSEYLLHLG